MAEDRFRRSPAPSPPSNSLSTDLMTSRTEGSNSTAELTIMGTSEVLPGKVTPGMFFAAALPIRTASEKLSTDKSEYAGPRPDSLIMGERGLANTTSMGTHPHGDTADHCNSQRFHRSLPTVAMTTPTVPSPLGPRRNNIAGFPQNEQKSSSKRPRSRSSSQGDGERSHWLRSKKQKRTVRIDSLREAAIKSRKAKDGLSSQHSGLDKKEEKGVQQYNESRHASAYGTNLDELEVKVEGTSRTHILDADTPKELGRQLHRVARVERKDRKAEGKEKESPESVQHVFG